MKANHFAQLACIFGCLAAGCATPSSDETAGDAEAEIEEQELDLTVETVETSHGAIRMTASMRDGSPDVSVWVGDSCEEAEIGRGIATRVRIVWTFTESEIARALSCGLVVRARNVQDGNTRVHKKTAVSVTGSVSLDDGPDDVSLQSSGFRTDGATLVVKGPMRSARLFTADGAVDALPASEKDEDHLESGRFEITIDALAHAAVSQSPMKLWSQGTEPAQLSASVQIGNVDLGAGDVTVGSVITVGESE